MCKKDSKNVRNEPKAKHICLRNTKEVGHLKLKENIQVFKILNYILL